MYFQGCGEHSDDCVEPQSTEAYPGDSRCTLAKAIRECSLSVPLPSTSNFEREWEFLCRCASPEADTAEIASRLCQGLDWNILLQLADAHGMPGILAQRLQQAAFAEVPASARETLQARIRAQSLFTLSMTAELFRIFQKFSTAEVRSVLVKGPLISFLAYGDPSIRSYVDLDLLVRHRDIARAVESMLALGFHSDIPASAMRAGKIPGEYLFRRAGTQRVIELHTEQTFRYYPKRMPIDDLFARSRTLVLDGRKIPVLSLEDEFVLNCIHGAKHFWERLMWVSDVAAVINRHPELDWHKARHSAKQVGAERMLSVGILVGASLLRLKLPNAVAGLAEPDRAAESLCRQIQGWLPFAGVTPPPLHKRAMFRLRMAGGGLTGFAYLMRLSFSPTQEDWTKGREERSSWLWDSLRRPFRLFRKYGSD